MMASNLVNIFRFIYFEGDILLVALQLYKTFHYDPSNSENSSSENKSTHGHESPNTLNDDTGSPVLHRLYLENVSFFVTISLTATFISYFSLGGFLQYQFYYKRKEEVSRFFLKTFFF